MSDRQANGTKITTYDKVIYNYYKDIIENKNHELLGYVLHIESQGIPIKNLNGCAVKKYTIVFTDESL